MAAMDHDGRRSGLGYVRHHEIRIEGVVRTGVDRVQTPDTIALSQLDANTAFGRAGVVGSGSVVAGGAESPAPTVKAEGLSGSRSRRLQAGQLLGASALPEAATHHQRTDGTQNQKDP